MQNDSNVLVTQVNGSDKKLSIGEASEYLGISIDTLRRWEKKGRIQPYRSPGGHRYFSRRDLDELFGRKYERDPETKPRQISKDQEQTIKEPKDEVSSIPKIASEVPEILDNPLSDIPPELLRPSRYVEIPSPAPIRIIRETYQEEVSVEVSKDNPPEMEKASILTPPADISTPVLSDQEVIKPKVESSDQKEVFVSQKVAITLTVILTVIISLGALSFFLWQKSKIILSPIP